MEVPPELEKINYSQFHSEHTYFPVCSCQLGVCDVLPGREAAASVLMFLLQCFLSLCSPQCLSCHSCALKFLSTCQMSERRHHHYISNHSSALAIWSANIPICTCVCSAYKLNGKHRATCLNNGSVSVIEKGCGATKM